ncbi:MAG: RNA methyltransferase [Chloroflexi bacterium]|nr:RNA methyltransferase [Chloroflexota bacterium]
MSEEQAILEGQISVEAVLRAGSRSIEKLLIRVDGSIERDVVRLMREAERMGIKIERVSSAVIDEKAQGKTHGGVIALVGERRFVPLESLATEMTRPFIVMLDGVEDPFNFGQALRAFYAAGADGLVLRPRNWMSAAGVVARSSAGASELMPTAIAETTQAAADVLRQQGLRVAVATKERAVSIYEADLSGPLFLVVGGEKRGVTRSFEDVADLRLSIPYGRRYAQSLGTTAAAAVLAFEIMRQRVNKNPTDDEP